MDIWLPNRANFVYLTKLHQPLVNKMTRYPPHTAEADWDCRPSSEFRHLRHDCSPRCLTKMTRYLTTPPWLFTTMFDQDDPVPHHFTLIVHHDVWPRWPGTSPLHPHFVSRISAIPTTHDWVWGACPQRGYAHGTSPLWPALRSDRWLINGYLYRICYVVLYYVVMIDR